VDINTLFTIAGMVLSVGISYGIITTQIGGIQKELMTMEQKIEKCPTREGCSLKHDHINQSMADMKNQLARIEHMLQAALDKAKRRDSKDE
jgi:hypothetical protein